MYEQLSCCTMQQLQHPRDVPTRREDGREHLSCLPLRTSGCGVRQVSREQRCSEGTRVPDGDGAPFSKAAPRSGAALAQTKVRSSSRIAVLRATILLPLNGQPFNNNFCERSLLSCSQHCGLKCANPRSARPGAAVVLWVLLHCCARAHEARRPSSVRSARAT